MILHEIHRVQCVQHNRVQLVLLVQCTIMLERVAFELTILLHNSTTYYLFLQSVCFSTLFCHKLQFSHPVESNEFWAVWAPSIDNILK